MKVVREKRTKINSSMVEMAMHGHWGSKFIHALSDLTLNKERRVLQVWLPAGSTCHGFFSMG